MSKVRHTSPKLNKAGKDLQSKRTSSESKSKAGKVLKTHQDKCHK